MILDIWQYLRGFVTVTVTGFSLERFLNMAAYHGIYIWDVSRTETGVTMKVSAKGFKLLKDALRKTKTKIKITEKHGLPFAIFRYRHRKVLIGGVIFFILALYALSSFVWRIEITGNERIGTEDLLEFCKERGMYIGAYKGGFSGKKMSAALRDNFSDIGWADVYVSGTRVLVTLTETIPPKQIIDKRTPCDIVAAKDGLITAIVTGAGKPLVKSQDVVKKGETLVTGVIPLQPEGGDVSGNELVHAYAEVWAKRYTPIKFSVPLIYEEKEYTGRKKSFHEAQLLFLNGRMLPIWSSRISFEAYDKMTTRYQPGVSGNYPLPLVLVTHTYSEFIMHERTRSAAEAATLAERMLNGRILREFDFGADIIDKQVTYTQTADELLVDALIVTNERIDTAVQIKREAQVPTEPKAPTGPARVTVPE